MPKYIYMEHCALLGIYMFSPLNVQENLSVQLKWNSTSKTDTGHLTVMLSTKVRLHFTFT